MTPTLVASRERRDTQLVVTWIVLPLALLFAATVLLVRFNRKPVWKLVADPNDGLGLHPLFGFFSNVGIIGWCAGAAVALFAAWMLHARRAPGEAVRFYVCLGGFTTLMMIDDFFMIHDALAPKYLGLPEDVTYSLYGALFVAMFAACRRAWLARNPALFALAFSMLGFTAGIDALPLEHPYVITLAMCASKLLGIFTWGAWLITSARRDLEVPAAAEHPAAREVVTRLDRA